MTQRTQETHGVPEGPERRSTRSPGQTTGRTVRLTCAQALCRWLCAQKIESEGQVVPFVGGVWAIFGHGNVAGLGEALYEVREHLPTYRGHNEQSMAHAAIAYAKTLNRRRCMAVTTSIGPGATNLATAAATAHVNRLPLLLLPGDVFASRLPDPVLQQLEPFESGVLSVNDALRPLSRYFDRLTRPEQLLSALPRAMMVLTDPGLCGPVTLALCQDTQTEAYAYPRSFFEPRVWHIRRPPPDDDDIRRAVDTIRRSRRPLLVAGGGVHYAQAPEALRDFTDTTGIPVVETQAGKSALPWTHPHNLGAIGVTGTDPGNQLAREADLLLAVGTRMQDFTSGSNHLFCNPDLQRVFLNVQPYDAFKHQALGLVCDARRGLEALQAALAGWRAPESWTQKGEALRKIWFQKCDEVQRLPASDSNRRPTDAQVLGAVNRHVGPGTVMLGAAGTMPGEGHKFWRTEEPNGYHMEYGFSCMGYEIAGALGAKMARPDRDVVVMVGDGSYLMLNSELATAVMLGIRFTLVLTDNQGYGCIARLQEAVGGAPFNNLFESSKHARMPAIDYEAHARALGAEAEKLTHLADMEHALARARRAETCYCIVVESDPLTSQKLGGTWWEVAVPAVSRRVEVQNARRTYEARWAERAGLAETPEARDECQDERNETEPKP